ncbi:MAG: RDD family protein [Proteobacteria bacterium]|nr:RDD family protein [Pseudomonadota bacterium]
MDTVNDSMIAAPLWRRLAALVYDVFPLIALWMIAALLYLLPMGEHYNPQHPHWAARLGLQSALFTVTAAYFVVSWTRVGATIGMRAWRLKLVGEDGAKPGTMQSLARFFLALVSFAIVGVGFWWALFDARKRTLHDRVCGTVMVRMR